MSSAKVGLILSLLFILPLSLSCGDVKLAPIKPTAFSVGKIDAQTQLPPPEVKIGKLRAIFFVDQSFSMILGKCAKDLDGTDPALDGKVTPCVPQPGIDPEAHRFDAISKWLIELTALAKADPDSDVKVAIIPFSGGKKARPRHEEYTDPENSFRFLTLEEAAVWLAKLRAEHDQDLQEATKDPGATGKFLGTTAPYSTLNWLASIVSNEMWKLKSQGLIETTNFHFIYMSDGVFKPLEEHLKIALNKIGCPDCSKDPGHPACDNSAYICNGTCPWTYCNVEVPDNFKKSFGDPGNNKLDMIVSGVKTLLSYKDYFKPLSFSVSLVKIHPERVALEDQDDPKNPGVKNIFDEIFKKIPIAQRWLLNSSEPPFSFSTLGGGQLSFRLEQFYIVNLNAFVDKYGKLVADSDGDGVSDDEEILSGTDPTAYRSVSACADGIQRDYGCKIFNCSEDVDLDGDFLTDCEEKTIGTKVDFADTDGDKVIDIFEVLRGLNPVTNDNTSFTAGEKNVNDMMHFFQGVNPLVKLSKVDPRNRIQVQVKELGFKPTLNKDGARVLTGLYSINALNIPLMQTLATTQFRTLYKDTARTKPYSTDEVIGPTTHATNTNQLVMLGHVVATENPSVEYWLFKRLEITPRHKNDLMQLNVDLRDFKQIKLGKGTP